MDAFFENFGLRQEETKRMGLFLELGLNFMQEIQPAPKRIFILQEL